MESFEKKDIPSAPPLKKLIGPSFILLGLGLGSGELILWPYLSANYGMGIIWAAVIGISLQFFLNMEISRYTIATGESIFVGMARKFGRFAPFWFIFSTFIPWIWPGIIASSATVIANAFGFSYSKYIGIGLLLLIGIFLSAGKTIYKTQELIQKLIIMIGIPFIFIVTLFFLKIENLVSLFKGFVGIGDGFLFLPKDISLATFLGALAYAGAGGTLNLSQSLYAKEKGYGMAYHSGKLGSIFRGVKEDVKLEGSLIQNDRENLERFRQWWKRLNIEHAIVFWATGAFTMILLSLLSFSTVYGTSGIEKGINFVINESLALSSSSFRFLGTIFLLMVGLMLFGTQFSVFGSTSRIMSENLSIISKKHFPVRNLSKYFYFFLWIQIFAGILIFLIGITEPLRLVTIGAVLNALSMFVYTGMVYITNIKILPREIQPSILRKIMMFLAFLFYGSFGIFTLLQIIK